MSKPKVTEWYPGELKPCSDEKHIGMYARQYEDPRVGSARDWWDGQSWLYSRKGGRTAIWQERPWRGLTEPSK